MTNVGIYTQKNPSTRFIVKNIAPGNKRVRVFQYPILNGDTRDLLAIPGISEADIRHSLLKGELLLKFKAKELLVIDSDIDLLQFNSLQLSFLQSIGILKGLQVTGASGDFNFMQDVVLIGLKNSSNLVFTTPDKFVYDSEKKIAVYLNGVRQTITENFIIAESGGPGTGYDTVIMVEAPTSRDVLVADYFKDV